MAAKVMKPADSHPVPEALRNLHQTMVSELNRHLGSGAETQAVQNAAAAQPGDISTYIGRIQKAGNLLHTSSKRIRDLEDALYNAQSKHSELSAQLQQAEARCLELEEAVAAETQRATDAEARATAAEEAAGQLQLALANTSGDLNALTSTIENAFGAVGEVTPAARNAA
jgi:chromosome segregation ATPase